MAERERRLLAMPEHPAKLSMKKHYYSPAESVNKHVERAHTARQPPSSNEQARRREREWVENYSKCNIVAMCRPCAAHTHVVVDLLPLVSHGLQLATACSSFMSEPRAFYYLIFRVRFSYFFFFGEVVSGVSCLGIVLSHFTLWLMHLIFIH